MEKGRGVSMKKWLCSASSTSPGRRRQLLSRQSSAVRGELREGVFHPFPLHKAQIPNVGVPLRLFSALLPGDAQGWRRKGSAMPPWNRERGGFTQGKVMGMENGDVEQQGRL